ncbi:MAG: electron transport complex protein RnfA [Alkalispirochaetaceae bacterium]
MSYVSVMLTFIFVENVVLTNFLGICPFLSATRNSRLAFYLSVALTALMALLSILGWAVRELILIPLGASYLELVVFALLIATVSRLIFSLLRHWMPDRVAVLQRYSVLVVANASLFGVLLISSYRSYGFAESLLAALAAGVGFLLAVVGLAAVRERLEFEEIPPSFRGGPIVLISAGLFSLAFHAFDKLLLLRLLGSW